jgi:type IV pilus assembly protein PilN
MIRINLLAGERERPKKRAGFQIGQKVTVVCSLIVVLTALGVGWWYWSLHKQDAALRQDIVTAEGEAARLRLVINQVQRFEEQREQLQRRVTLIEELRRGQGAPVRLVDEISKAVPDALWLTELKQSGADLTLMGKSSLLTAIAEFVDNLEASGYFKSGFDMPDIQAEQQAAGRAGGPGDAVHRFTMKMQFATPGAQPAPKAQ